MPKTYEPVGTDIQVLKVTHLEVKLKAGEKADELVDKIESLIRRFSEDGNWWFLYKVKS
jgi:hypothetical protein